MKQVKSKVRKKIREIVRTIVIHKKTTPEGIRQRELFKLRWGVLPDEL